MTIEEFINEKLCPAGIVTAWDETAITTAYRIGDVETLTTKLAELSLIAGIEMPTNLILE